ncbi:MAG: pilus assembly protein [Methylobacteriaceae bacterium]|nr:pilus assembly protein [Methylobacteriaceae bacterium]
MRLGKQVVASAGRDERGAVALLFALVLVPLAGVIGAALDYSRATNVRSSMQRALDAAVLQGVQQRSDQQIATAQQVFASLFRQSSVTLSGPTFTQSNGTLSGSASATVPTTVMRMLRFSSLTVATSSAAAPGATAQPSTAVCILILDPSSQALTVNSGAGINAPNCEMHVRSTGNSAAIFNASSSLSLAKICVQSTSVIQNGGAVPNLKTGCAALSDPFAGTLPAPASTSCGANNGGNYDGSWGAVTLSPGVYCGWYNFNNAPTLNFNPGVYVIKGGGWNVNGGKWTGNGVTFYFADTSKIQFNSGMNLSLSAPTSGSYANLLIYEAAGLSRSQFVLNDSVAENLQGLIYLPSRDVTVNAGTNVSSQQIAMVFATLILNNVSWQLTPNAKAPTTSAAASGGVSYLKR